MCVYVCFTNYPERKLLIYSTDLLETSIGRSYVLRTSLGYLLDNVCCLSSRTGDKCFLRCLSWLRRQSRIGGGSHLFFALSLPHYATTFLFGLSRVIGCRIYEIIPRISVATIADSVVVYREYLPGPPSPGMQTPSRVVRVNLPRPRCVCTNIETGDSPLVHDEQNSCAQI